MVFHLSGPFLKKISKRLKLLGACCALLSKLVQGKRADILLLYFLGPFLPMFFPVRCSHPAPVCSHLPWYSVVMVLFHHSFVTGRDFITLSTSLLFVFTDYVSRLSVDMQVKIPADSCRCYYLWYIIEISSLQVHLAILQTNES